jgi:hypothetical protein
VPRLAQRAMEVTVLNRDEHRRRDVDAATPANGGIDLDAPPAGSTLRTSKGQGRMQVRQKTHFCGSARVMAPPTQISFCARTASAQPPPALFTLP